MPLHPLVDRVLGVFAHVIGPGEPLAVADSLGAPGEAWIAGDVLYQLHTLTLPRHIVAGEYPLAVGVYTRANGRRLVTSADQDMVPLLTLVVRAETGDE